jgi:hypothetical protein
MEAEVSMRCLRFALSAALMTAAGGCGGTSSMPATPSAVPVSTSSQPAPLPESGPCLVGFDELLVHGAAFTTHTACGLNIAVTAASWQVSTSYGHPAPFVQFLSPAGTTTTGEITATAVGATFAFTSVDIYSSTTKIPYEISGLAGGAVVFTIQGVQGNTFGNFATVAAAGATRQIQKLRIRLTNPAAPCCSNPVGLDNIRVVR